MRHLTEFLVQVAPHSLGWRVRVVQLRMLRLQVLQLPHQTVKLLIVDNGLVQHIVTVIMFMQLLS